LETRKKDLFFAMGPGVRCFPVLPYCLWKPETEKTRKSLSINDLDTI
jgi:hypothetical protein